MRKTTVLHCIASPFWGGGERYVYDLASQMLADGHRVIVYSPDSQILKEQFSKLEKYSDFSFVQKKKLFAANLLNLIHVIEHQQVDVVHIHNTKTLATAALAKTLSSRKFRLVLSIHLVKKSKNNFIRKWEHSKVDKFVFVSRLAAESYLKNADIQEDKINIVWNSILAPVASPETMPQLEPALCFVGRLAPEKGIDTLLEAIGKTESHCRLNIVGNGEQNYVGLLKQKAAQLNISDRVDFIGFTTDTDSYISNSLFGVLPSSAPESFGLANLEFMRCGKTQITSNNGAQKEYLSDEVTALLVEPENPVQLAEKIDFLIQNPQKCKEMGEKAKDFFEKELSYEHFYKKILKIYED